MARDLVNYNRDVNFDITDTEVVDAEYEIINDDLLPDDFYRRRGFWFYLGMSLLFVLKVLWFIFYRLFWVYIIGIIIIMMWGLIAPVKYDNEGNKTSDPGETAFGILVFSLVLIWWGIEYVYNLVIGFLIDTGTVIVEYGNMIVDYGNTIINNIF